MPTVISPDWLQSVTFILEGVLLLVVACIGLTGIAISFVVLVSKKVQKTFHNLLLLLNTFDMVGFRKDKLGLVVHNLLSLVLADGVGVMFCPESCSYHLVLLLI